MKHILSQFTTRGMARPWSHLFDEHDAVVVAFISTGSPVLKYRLTLGGALLPIIKLSMHCKKCRCPPSVLSAVYIPWRPVCSSSTSKENTSSVDAYTASDLLGFWVWFEAWKTDRKQSRYQLYGISADRNSRGLVPTFPQIFRLITVYSTFRLHYSGVKRSLGTKV